MTTKQKYNRIDQSKLDSAQVGILKSISQKTDDFKIKDKVILGKIDMALDKIISALEEKNPSALKPIAKRTPAKSGATKPSSAKSKSSATKAKSIAPKTAKTSLLVLAKEIRKSDESWDDARKRASEIMKDNQAQVKKIVNSELQKLYELVKTRKELQGFANSDIKRDAVRDAKPRGARVVTKQGSTSNQYGTFDNKLGRKYWETRDRHADRLAPNYPKDMPLLASGGAVSDAPFSVEVFKTKLRFDNELTSSSKGDFPTFAKAKEFAIDMIDSGNYYAYINSKSGYLWGVDSKGVEQFADGGGIDGGMNNLTIQEVSFAKGGQVKNLMTILHSKYYHNSMSLKDIHDECVMNLGKEKGELIFQEFIKENKGVEKFMEEFNTTSFAKGGKIKHNFEVGETVSFPPVKNPHMDKPILNMINSFSNKELVIEKIKSDKPYNLADVYVKSTGEKLTNLILNPNYLKIYPNDKSSKDVKIKDWYTKTYPTDDLGEELDSDATFEDVWTALHNGTDVYSVFGVGDSVIRERLFEELCNIYGVDYSYVYKKWLESNDYANGGSTQKYKAGQKFYDTRYDRVCEIVTPSYDGLVSWKRYNKTGTDFENDTVHSLVENQFDYLVNMGAYQLSKQSMASGGEVKSVVDALFEFNEKRGKLNTSFGAKTKEGVTALIENENYSSEEIAKAIFYTNDKKGKISTGYGDKSFFGLQDMIERARGKEFANGGIFEGNTPEYLTDPTFGDFQDGVMFKSGGQLTNEEKLLKELHRLQRDLNSSRLSTYREGDTSQEEMARQKERESKLARFNEVLKELRENDAKFAEGGSLEYLTDPNFGDFQNTGSFADGGGLDKYKLELYDMDYAFISSSKLSELKKEYANEIKNKGYKVFDLPTSHPDYKRGNKWGLFKPKSFELDGKPYINSTAFADGGSMAELTEQEFLKKYFGANVFTENPSQYFEIKKMSSSDDDKISAFVKELKADGFAIKKRAYSDFTSVMGVKKKGSFADGGSLEYLTDPNFGDFQNTGSFADGGLVVSNSNDLEEVAKYMTNAVKKRKWDLKDLIYYFEKENNFDYKYRVKIWDEMNGYEMRKTYENILEMLRRIVEANGKKFELGGAFMMTDLAGHTGGSDGLGNPMPLSGVTGTNYTGLVGETGAMSSGELFEAGGVMMQNQQVIEDASQPYVITEAFGNSAQQLGAFKDGGSIPNNYKGRTAEDVWDNWSSEQKSHFLQDHKYNLFGDIVVSKIDREKALMTKFKDLSRDLRVTIEDHIDSGQYAYGGKTKKGVDIKEVSIESIAQNSATNKDAVRSFVNENNLSESEITALAMGVGRQLITNDFVTALAGRKNNPYVKKVVAFTKSGDAYKMANGGAFAPNVSNGTQFMSEVYADGGAINGMLNKKIQKLADDRGITMDDLGRDEYNKVIAQALVESLTDANFHDEAKQVVVKAEGKTKWSDDLYQSESFNPESKVALFAREVARICEWDGDDIINAYYFITKMQGSKVGNMIDDLFLNPKPTSASSKTKIYVDHDDIYSVTLKIKGKTVTISGSDVLNGANLLEEGGDLSKIAFYVAKRDVLSVKLKNGDSIKPVNGYWVKKDYQPITTSAPAPKKPSASGARFKFDIGDKVMIDDSGYVKAFTEFDLSKPAEIIDRSTSKMSGKTYYFYKVKMADGRIAFNQAEQSKLKLADKIKPTSKIDETKAHFQADALGNVFVDSNFVNQSKNNLPNSELKHYGFGEFYLQTPDGNIDFIRTSEEKQGFVGRTHKLSGSNELILKLVNAMKEKGRFESTQTFASGGSFAPNVSNGTQFMSEVYADGGNIEKGSTITLKNDVYASYTNELIPKGTKLRLIATPPKLYGKNAYFVYAKTLNNKEEIRTDKSNFVEKIKELESYFADGGETIGNNIDAELEDFDIDELDDFETMQYNQFLPKLGKVGALQVLINNVEGDYTQLSPELAELAEMQMSGEEYDEATREMRFERDGYAKGGELQGKFLAEIGVPYNFEYVVEDEYEFSRFLSKALTNKFNFGNGAWGIKIVKPLFEKNYEQKIVVEIEIPIGVTQGGGLDKFDVVEFISKTLTKKWFGNGVWSVDVVGSYAKGGSFKDNDGFMKASNERGYRYPEREVRVDTIDDYIDLSNNVNTRGKKVVVESLNEDINLNEEGRIRAKLTQSGSGSFENFSKANARAFEYMKNLPKTTSKTHKND